MLLPYKDINPTKRFALITFLIIVANVYIFLDQYVTDLGFPYGVRDLALIPVELLKGNLPGSEATSPVSGLVTSVFVHGGFKHLAFNMLFLWIFGNNVEDMMTRPRFLLFYLVIGVISSLSFAVTNPGSEISLVGASGSISGIIGAYLFLFPKARVHALFFIIPIRMPAIVFIVIWFFGQISGFLGGGGNVAWICHISGFIAGILLFRFFLRRS